MKYNFNLTTMKKFFFFLTLIFLVQKSFAQCGTTVSGGPMFFCWPGCNGSFTLNSTGGTPPYYLTVNSVPIGTYTSSYTMNNQCAGYDTCTIFDNAFSCFDTIVVTITQLYPPPITMQVMNATCSSCSDGVIIPSCSTCAAYLWSDTSMTHTNLLPGTYYVTVSDANGCVNSASATVGVGNVGTCSASFTMYPTGNPHDYWVVNNSTGVLPLQYDWNWGDGSPHDTAAFPTHTYAVAGIYNMVLTITDATGCMNMQILNSYLARMYQILTVTVVPQLPTSALELSEEDIFIYPNPALSDLMIENGELKIQSVEIYDLMGKNVYSEKPIPGNQKSLTIDISKFDSGIYFVAIKDAEGRSVVKKIVKM